MIEIWVKIRPKVKKKTLQEEVRACLRAKLA